MAELDGYTVSNSYNSTEHFYYQYTIRAGSNFIVPNGRRATIESVNEVILETGFTAASGSTFLAKIDEDDSVLTEKSLANSSKVKVVPNYFDAQAMGSQKDVYINRDTDGASSLGTFSTQSIHIFPNPSLNFVSVDLGKYCRDHCTIEITNSLGAVVLTKEVLNSSSQTLDIQNFTSGIYLLSLRKNGETIARSKLIKQ